MNGIDVIRTIVRNANKLMKDVMSGVTDEQARALPEGTANNIGVTYAHVLNTQDGVIHRTFGDGKTIWESEGWGEKLGLPNVARLSPEKARDFSIDLEKYNEYAERVLAAVDAYLETLTEEELNREVQGYRGPTPVGMMIAGLLTNHTAEHMGEVAAIKGTLGLKGLLV